MGSAEGNSATSETLKLRYTFDSEVQPTGLKAALEKVKGVQRVEIAAATRCISVQWMGRCRDVVAIENASMAAGVPAAVINHAHVYIAFKALKGADLERMRKELAARPGVKGVEITAAGAELHVDLEELTVGAVRDAAQAARLEVQFRSHRWVEVHVAEEHAVRLAEDLSHVRGVLVVKAAGPVIGFWAHSAVPESAYKKVAEGIGAHLDSIQYP